MSEQHTATDKAIVVEALALTAMRLPAPSSIDALQQTIDLVATLEHYPLIGREYVTPDRFAWVVTGIENGVVTYCMAEDGPEIRVDLDTWRGCQFELQPRESETL